MKKINFSILLAIVLLFITTSSAFAAARLSGKLLSASPEKRMYVIQLKDGTKLKVHLAANGKIVRNYGSGAFRVGEIVVFNVISALNENPILADSMMDVAYAKTNAITAYKMPRNTPIGGTATIAGPVVMAGETPNVIGGLANGGTVPQDPYAPENSPFKASPAAMNSPATGQVLTNPNIQQPQPNLLDSNSGSGNFNQPPISALNNSQNAPLASDPASMITGSSKATTPQQMIYNDPSMKKSGGNVADNPSLMLGGGNDDEDEEDEDPFAPKAQVSKLGTQAELNVRIMKTDMPAHVIFYMVLGAQELGTATFTQNTKVVNATGQPASIQNLQPGVNVKISGIRRDANSINAMLITIIP